MPRPTRMLAVLLLLLAVCGPVAAEEGGDESLLTPARIYGSREFDAQRFSARWLPDGSAYETWEESEETDGGRDLVVYDVPGDGRRVLVPAAHLVPQDAAAPLAVEDYTWSADRARLLIYTNSKRVWRRNTRGDYWVLDRASRELRQLGGDAPASTLMFATFAPSGRQVAYVRDKNVYVEDLDEQHIRQVTHASSDDVINGTFDWVYEEELGLRNGYRWSPDGRHIAFWQIDTTGVRDMPLIDNTRGLYPRITWIKYPKVGQMNSACRVGVVEVDSGRVTFMQVPGDPRQRYIARMDWAGDSGQLVFQQLNRLQNTNRVMLANAATGKVQTILTERDAAWVDVHDELRWLADGQQFTWISERDGWRHVYRASREAPAEPQLITPGDYDVLQLVHVDEEQGALYFIASPDNPTQRYLYRAPLSGGAAQRLTPVEQAGTHSYQVSPNGRWAIHSYSSFDAPPVTELVNLPEHETLRVLADNRRLRKKLAKLASGGHEFFRVDIGDDVRLDAWCLRPADFDPGQKYPLLVYVYGEPAGQTVLDRWAGSRYLWHLMLAQRGYVVMSFDNRGTPAPRGREWRKCVYRQVGILAPRDQAAAVRTVLAERDYLDPQRVGVWGWSGGGSMSLNAIFKYPDLYHTAVAVAPVPNQRYYDTIYQERYMALPGDNVDGFVQGSPINFAHQLAGNLLLIHGTGDDNVHYQGTEALVNELIRHNKPFTMMAYPNRTHAIREGKNTSRHLHELMLRYLTENLPPGPQ